LLDVRLTDRNSAPFALCLFDVDHFKNINDEFGHAVGDEVLVRVADEVGRFVHPAEDEFACRFGGEEFLCVLNCEDVPALAARLEAYRQAISAIRIQPEGATEARRVHISGGIAFCPAEHDDADALIKLADDRLYAAKESGRDRIFMESGVQETTP
jgi:diguanylate cyclase (GGDEF)-like protein